MPYVNTQLTTWMNKCHPLGVKIMVDLYDSTSKLASIVSNSTLLTQLAVNVKNLVVANNLDGVSLDWEVTKSQAQMDTLIDAIYAQLNPIGKEIVIAGNWYAPDCSVAGLQKINFVNIMTYDMTWAPAVGRLPQHSLFDDMVSAMMLWANAGYSKSKLGAGIPFYAKDTAANAFTWSEVVNALHPATNVNQANVTSIMGWNGVSRPVSGGVIWWNGLDLIKQKLTWLISNGFGGVMEFSLPQDSFVSGFNMLNTISQGGNIMVTFNGTVSSQVAAGGVVTIKVTKPDTTTVNVTATTTATGTFTTTYTTTVAGAYTAQASIPADATYKAVSSAVVPFTVALLDRTITLTVV
jgi:GH18 family chitinase